MEETGFDGLEPMDVGLGGPGAPPSSREGSHTSALLRLRRTGNR